MSYINQGTWNKYKNILREFHDDAMQEDIIWKRTFVRKGRFNEDTRREEINLKGLVHYNYFRNWPINDINVTGEIDKESVLLYLNQDYLEELNYLDSNNQFNFNQGLDRFIIEGITYKPMGHSKAGQTKNDTVLVFIILQKEELNTGT